MISLSFCPYCNRESLSNPALVEEDCCDISELLDMSGLRAFHFLSAILLFVASGSPVINGQSMGELSTS